MEPLSLFLLGLELRRFAPADDAAASLGDSLEVVEAGGLSLAPYEGPALQPVVGWRSGRVALSLAPGLAVHSSTAWAADGREARVQTVQWRTEARAWLLFDPALAGLDLGVSGGSATSGGATVAQAPLALEVAPTAGVRVDLHPSLDLVLRGRLPVRVADDALDVGLAGALGIEWHRRAD